MCVRRCDAEFAGGVDERCECCMRQGFRRSALQEASMNCYIMFVRRYGAGHTGRVGEGRECLSICLSQGVTPTVQEASMQELSVVSGVSTVVRECRSHPGCDADSAGSVSSRGECCVWCQCCST